MSKSLPLVRCLDVCSAPGGPLLLPHDSPPSLRGGCESERVACDEVERVGSLGGRAAWGLRQQCVGAVNRLNQREPVRERSQRVE